MYPLRFNVVFHGPFRVGTGNAANGAHQTAWHTGAGGRTQVAPASTVKGVMRAAAETLLPKPLVSDVFGSPGTQCPWRWSPLDVRSGAVSDRRRTRIEIDPTTGTVAGDMLAVAEELVITGTGEFTIGRLGFVRLSGEDERRDRAVLTVAAGLITGMGGTRRRGLGWVSIRPQVEDPRAEFASAVAAVPELIGGTA